jgi:DNA-binding NtrC family response regulator
MQAEPFHDPFPFFWKGGAAMATVLIVESYPNLASLYNDILSEEGHAVLVASTCKEANEIAKARGIDLVVMDEGLPDGTEEELIKRLKIIQPHIKAILCSLDELSPKTYRNLCDEGFFKSSDYTVIQKKINYLSKMIANRDSKHL